jgi:SAM-dependent methyltransferase
MTESLALRDAQCPACGDHVAVPLFEGGRRPLATLAWPRTSQEARDLPTHALDFVCCTGCGHVFNAAFDYRHIPYSEKPNLMFNTGSGWSEFIASLRTSILGRLPEKPVVVEVGCGDGSFLRDLAAARPEGRYIGFDPHGLKQDLPGIDFRAELFDAAIHLAQLRPDLIISRHVLEHLRNPLGFIQRISVAAALNELTVSAYFEVPCIDTALASYRTVDFYYEHSSQFTSHSFREMLVRSGAEILDVECGYSGEVIYGYVRLGKCPKAREIADQAAVFLDATSRAVGQISEQLARLHRSGASVAIWGGTGKAAAFMSRHAVDAERFPTVVDSDRAKVGSFVPGTGQEIRFRDWLLEHPAEVVIIPAQWRAKDIVSEMADAGICPSRVLIEHSGHLVDYHRDDHPYRSSTPNVPAADTAHHTTRVRMREIC